MRLAGRVVAEMHEATRAAIAPGVTTKELNEVAADVIERRGARSNFLNYHGFPAVICTSPNSMIVHGIPGDYTLQEGDIISVDCGAIVEGYHGDAAYTAGGGRDHRRGAAAPGGDRAQPLRGDRPARRRATASTRSVARSSTVAEAAGFSVVREYVGHAIGTAMHESPQVPNYWPGTPGPTLKTGMVFAIEPMVNAQGPRDRAAGRRLVASSPPTARCRRTSSTRSRSPTTAPRSSPSPEPAASAAVALAGPQRVVAHRVRPGGAGVRDSPKPRIG